MATLTRIAMGEEYTCSGDVTRWVNRLLGTGYQRFGPGQEWLPAVNLYEDDNQYAVVVELAGVDSESIELTVTEGVLTLSGRRPMPRFPHQAGPLRVHLMEIDHGAFSRKIELPSDADLDGISASYRCGLLDVRIPKHR